MRTPEYLQLLTTTQSRLYGYILSLVFDPDHANDILQQTNAILWEKEEDFELGTNFVAWAFRIAHFQVLAHRKQQQRDRLVFDDDMLGDLATMAGQSDDDFELRQRRLRTCIEKLPARQRDIVRRRYTTGSQLQTIANETDQTVNSVKQILFRARAALIQCVNSGLTQEII
ncbi:RNA polymerase sigma-70 factor (ECF subfamily) [Rhodopirellula rubra]|uniref:RNA polymerase sigma-70 factor (ECF subfamily) n=1 Tax=Aporhodopirellula rubra TaxID=980271 RepID=A0A7W5E4A3_9BACT|nr:sigma-70 family RNA polymerase sigma factor [Aporhodopirellula rubra]MBB3209524.1 RNA polymerase sigma-70 factor (ECF subfamily) [Aporhodopirellula rubra]